MKRLFLSVGLTALASAANAQLFTPGADFTVASRNSPSNADDIVPFTPGTYSLEGGLLSLTLSLAPVGGASQAEWAVFQYHSVGGSPLSDPTQDWEISQNALQISVPVNFIGDFTQFTDFSGVTFDQTVSIFGDTVMANPVPGGTGNGEGNTGFVSPFPAGFLFPLGRAADPFSDVTGALGTTTVFGVTQAFELEPQSPITGDVPEPSTWAMLLLGFAWLGYAGFRRTSKLRLA